MKKKFNKTAPPTPLSEAEAFLQKEGIEYRHRDDGTIFVPGDINISHRGLTKLPDLSNVDVSGSFFCSFNLLINLIGAPQTVGHDFWCNHNQLTGLVGAPQTVGRDFAGHHNRLTSLEGAPQSVGRDFSCDRNELPDLYYAPRKFKKLYTDFGTFSSWDEIPNDVKMSAQTKKRLEEQLNEELYNAMYNSPAMPFKPPPLRKRPGPR